MSSRVLIVLALLATTTMAARAAPDSMTFGTHTIVSPAQRVGYIMTADTKRVARLVAVDLVTGKQRWSSSTAVKPIVAQGNRLVALDNAGNVIVLDTKTGKPAKPCGAIAGAKAPFLNGLGLHQSAWGFDDGAALYLVWLRMTHHVGGAAPSPEIEKSSRTRTETTWKLDLSACTATVATPTIPDMKLTIDATTDVLTPGGKLARFTRDANAGTFTFVPAGGGQAIDLTQGDRARYAVSVSIDRRFAMCGDPSNANLAVFDLQTGAVSRPKLPGFVNKWIVVGARFVVWTGGLTAYDPKTAKPLWTFGERNTSYTGPYPP
ncbi:MAG: PQQ-binding-like beta-propeller repeat protein [Kofleriaceae bacterium]